MTPPTTNQPLASFRRTVLAAQSTVSGLRRTNSEVPPASIAYFDIADVNFQIPFTVVAATLEGAKLSRFRASLLTSAAGYHGSGWGYARKQSQWLAEDPKRATQEGHFADAARPKGDQMKVADAIMTVIADQHATETAVPARPALGDDGGG
jgi:hypothetical protein